jgi:tetratricopeptide (TPR) repeat protein
LKNENEVSTPIQPQMARLDVSKAKTALQSALELHRSGQLAEAERIYRKILKVVPDHFAAIHLLGTCLLQRRQFVEGEQLIAKALKLNPNDPSALNNRGGCLQELKRLDEALASYDKAIALKPDFAEAFNNRGNCLRELKRLNEALTSYESAWTRRWRATIRRSKTPSATEAVALKNSSIWTGHWRAMIRPLLSSPILPKPSVTGAIVFKNSSA